MSFPPTESQTEVQGETRESMFHESRNHHGHESGHEPGHEFRSGEHNSFEMHSSDGSMADSNNASSSPLTTTDFAQLEDRILRAVHLVRSERQARTAAEEQVATLQQRAEGIELHAHQLEERAANLTAQLQAQALVAEQNERLQQEVDALRIEREQVGKRIERLLSQLDALEL